MTETAAILEAIARLERKVDALARPVPKLLSRRAAARMLGVDRGSTLKKLLKHGRVRLIAGKIPAKDLELLARGKYRQGTRKNWEKLPKPPACAICGYPHELQWHHIVPLAEGGPDDVANLVALCPNCHAAAHAGRLSREVLFAARRDPQSSEGAA